MTAVLNAAEREENEICVRCILRHQVACLHICCAFFANLVFAVYWMNWRSTKSKYVRIHTKTRLVNDSV